MNVTDRRLRRILHGARMGGLGAAMVALGACGATSTAPTPTPTAGGTSAPASTPTASATTAPNAGSAAAAAMALTVDDLPSGGPDLTQISDGAMNNIANTDQRGFANSTNTYRIEDDVVIDTSADSATSDYAQLRDAAKGQVATLSSSSSPPGLGAQADEYIGQTSNGYSTVGITFQSGAVIAILLIVDSQETVDPSFAEAVAQVQVQKIIAASG